MLHIHFGAGRLGLGLVAPFFQKPGSELYLLNRAVSAARPTGATGLTPERRNQLLHDHPRRQYFIQKPGGSRVDRQVVHYDGFFPYEENQLPEIIHCIAHRSAGKGAGGGCADLKHNEYLNAAPDNSRFADAALTEMCEGIAALLRSEPEYADFVADVDIDDYLDGARRVVLDRFASTEDSIARILARFRAPTAGEFSTIESFVQRFSSRVDAPMQAYERARGFPPPMASQGILKLFRLIAGQQFVNTAGQG